MVMAAVDRIYGTQKEWNEFSFWVFKNNPFLKMYFYPKEGYSEEGRPITSFPTDVDMWLLSKQPPLWVVRRIMEQYDWDESPRNLLDRLSRSLYRTKYRFLYLYKRIFIKPRWN